MLECSWSSEIEEDLAAVLDAMDAHKELRMQKNFRNTCAANMELMLLSLFMLFKLYGIIDLSWWLVVGISVLVDYCFTKIFSILILVIDPDPGAWYRG